MRAKPISSDEQLRLVIECRSSGLSDYQWCQMNGIKSGTFYNWVSRLRNSGTAVPYSTNETETQTVVEQSVIKMEEFKELHVYYTTRRENPLKKMQSLIVIACKLLRIIYTILKKGTVYDPKKMLMDIRHASKQEVLAA